MPLQSKPVLTNRQTEILELLKKGLTNQDICRLLGISPNTVKVHLAKIYKILEVSNRTEAACYGDVVPVGDDYAQIIFRFNPAVASDAKAKWCVASIAQGLQKFELLQIIVENGFSDTDANHFWLTTELSSPGVQPKRMFLSLHHKLSKEVLWAEPIDLSEGLDETVQLQRLVVKLATQVEKHGAELYQKASLLNSGWWYASMYGKKAISVRTISAWQESVKITEMAHNNQPEKILPIYSLALNWYKALLERWVPPQVAIEKIEKYSSYCMRYAPDSQYSLLTMSMTSVVHDDNATVIKYLTKSLSINPLNISVLQMLAQIYTLDNQEAKGFEVLAKMKKVAPEIIESPNNMVAEALLLFLTNQFEACVRHCEEILFVMPEYLVPRLLLISALGWLGDKVKSDLHIIQLHKYHPNFKQQDLASVLGGVHPSKRHLLLEGAIKTGLVF